MAPTTPAQARIGRLTGRGRTDDRGGGLPLTDLFTPIMRTLVEKGEADAETLTAAVRAGFIGRKTDRLQYMYEGEDPWPALMGDALNQLAARGLVVGHPSGAWTIGEKFVLGKSLVVIPGSGRFETIRVTVQTDEQRKVREGETLSMFITELASELDPRRGGIRPIDSKRVTELVESIEAFGFRPEFPVLYDQHGRLLDGRHRTAAAETLGIEPVVKVVRVENDREALALTWAANAGQTGWTGADLSRITKALGGIAPTEALSEKVQVRNMLLDYKGRVADREVARAIKVDHKTVAARRADLEREGAIEPYNPIAELHEAIRDELVKAPKASNREIARRTGSSAPTVAVVRESVKGGESMEIPQPLQEPESEPTPPALTKGQLADRALLADPTQTNEEIAEQVGMDPKSVWRRRKKLEGHDPYNGSIEGKRSPRTTPPAPTPAPAGPPPSLELKYSEDARVLAAEISAWMTDANVLLELGNRLISTAKRRGAQ